MPTRTDNDTNLQCGLSPQDKPVRIDLPVAPRRNAMGAFEEPSGRKAVSPARALALLDEAMVAGVPVVWAKVSGPGDPLAVPEPVLETLRQVRASYPDMTLSLATNGLYVADHADALAGLGLSFVTLLVNAVDPDVAAKAYAWIRPGVRTMPLSKATLHLVEAQNAAVRALAAKTIPVMVRTTVYPGVNLLHVAQIAETMAAMGATAMNLVPYVPPSQGEPPLPALTPDQMAEAKAAASAGLAIVAEPGHCGGRAMDMENHPKGRAILDKFRQGPSLPTPSGDRPRTAVASSGGMDVDLHLGHAASFLIYGKDAKDGLVSLLDKRDAPEPGTGDGRWHKLAETLGDCSVVLAAGAGQRPRDVLGSHGIRVLVTEGSVEGAVDALYGGGKGRGKRP